MKKRTTFFFKFSRTIAALFMIPAFCFTAVSCSDDDDDPADPNLVGDMPASVTLAATEDNNTATISFTAALAWKAAYATEDDKWFTFTPEAGTTAGKVTITVSAPKNSDAAKSGKIIIKHGTQSYTVTVNQAPGSDDPASWNKTDLQGTVFAPDPYNTTEEAIAEKTFTVTNIFDYATLEKAPYEIFTFYVDEKSQVQDSLIDWVNFAIAENSPAAKDGKKIVVSVKPHEQIDSTKITVENPNGSTKEMYVYEMNERSACIVLAPKGTAPEEIFANGEVKEEYTSAIIRQNPYKASLRDKKASITWFINFPFTPPTNDNDQTDIILDQYNFELAGVEIVQGDKEQNWVNIQVVQPNIIRFTKGEVTTSSNISVALKINRGPDLEPFISLYCPVAQIFVSATKM